jgi:hypothetical protein
MPCSRATNTYMRGSSRKRTFATLFWANSAKLMTHDFRSKQDMKVGVDRGRAFMIVEIAEDNLYLQTISRTGQTIDSGTVARRGNERNLTLIFMDSFFEPTDIRRAQWTKTNQQQKTTAY